MKDTFISYRPYKDLTWVESMLMSWIISLSDAKQSICFSNEYASKMLKVSDRTISSSISKLKSSGYINTFQTRERRFITLLKRPEVEDISFQSCDLEGLENNSTESGNNFNTEKKILPHRVENISTQTGNNFQPDTKPLQPRVENMTTNNKEYKKDNNIAQASYESDLRFTKIVGLFPKGKQMGIEDAYNYTWLFLKEEDKKEIETILPVYIQRNQNEPKYIKPINKYFNEQFWKSDDVSISLLNKPTKPRKLYF